MLQFWCRICGESFRKDEKTKYSDRHNAFVHARCHRVEEATKKMIFKKIKEECLQNSDTLFMASLRDFEKLIDKIKKSI